MKKLLILTPILLLVGCANPPQIIEGALNNHGKESQMVVIRTATTKPDGTVIEKEKLECSSYYTGDVTCPALATSTQTENTSIRRHGGRTSGTAIADSILDDLYGSSEGNGNDGGGTTTGKKPTTATNQVVAQPVVRVREIMFQGVAHFDTKSAVLTQIQKQQLKSMGKQILAEKGTGVKINLYGFADPVPLSTGNQKLSEQRANAVKDVLVAMGFTNVTAIGLAETGQYGDSRDGEVNKYNRTVNLGIVEPA